MDKTDLTHELIDLNYFGPQFIQEHSLLPLRLVFTSIEFFGL